MDNFRANCISLRIMGSDEYNWHCASKTMKYNREDKYAILSVDDKTGIVDLAHALPKANYTLLCTPGTLQTIWNSIAFDRDGRVSARTTQLKGIPAFFKFKQHHSNDVKSIHPAVVRSILQQPTLKPKYPPIKAVICNLPTPPAIDAMDQMDVGGQTLIRAAIKNYQHTPPVTDPQHYPKVIRHLSSIYPIPQQTSLALAATANQHLIDYSKSIQQTLEDKWAYQDAQDKEEIKRLVKDVKFRNSDIGLKPSESA